MSEPMVSIIMPAYNAEKYLADAIRSVLAQTFQNWELIIVDDGSTDGTREIAGSFSSQDERIKYISQPNRKLANARNNGLKNSSGGLIAFLDSDDLWMSHKLEAQLVTMLETGADVVFSDGFVFRDDETTSESVSFGTVRGRFTGEEMFELLLMDNRVPVLSALARKEVLIQAGLFDEDARLHYGCEDYDLWLRVARTGATFYGMEEKLVRYRVHGSSMSGKKVELLEATISTVKKYMAEPAAQTVSLNKRFRVLYRALTAALLEQNRVEEARKSFRELCKWDRFGFVTSIQRVLIKVAPRKYNRLSDKLYDAGSRVNAFRANLK